MSQEEVVAVVLRFNDNDNVKKARMKENIL